MSPRRRAEIFRTTSEMLRDPEVAHWNKFRAGCTAVVLVAWLVGLNGGSEVTGFVK